jgi:hypothetical protein
MKNVFVLLFLVLTASMGYAQVPLIDKDGPSRGTVTRQDIARMPSRNATVRERATNEAKYPGGRKALESYLSKNITYPNRVPYQGKMIVKFRVNKSGEVKEVAVTFSPYGDYVNSKLIQAFERMPHWIPAEQSAGKSKSSYMEVPIYIATTTKRDSWDWRLTCDFYPSLF